MVLARAYFDESGIHDGSPVVAVAGLMATEKRWSSLEADWLAELNRLAPGLILPPFHASKCEVGVDEFERVPDVVRENLPRRLAAIIEMHSPVCIWSSIARRHWDELADAKFRAAYPHPFHLCFEWCAYEMARWQREVAETSPIALIYSEQEDFEDSIEVMWDAYNRAKRIAPLNTFTTASYKNCVPLQAADLVAYECFRHWKELEVGDGSLRAPRPGAKALLTGSSKLEMIGHHTRETLRSVIRQFHEGRWPYELL